MSTENHQHFESIIKEIGGAELGNLFGKPCGKLNKKAFVAFFEDEMVFKVGRTEVDFLLKKYDLSKKWDPSGKNRAMKDWIQVPQEYMSDWKKLALSAIDFLNE